MIKIIFLLILNMTICSNAQTIDVKEEKEILKIIEQYLKTDFNGDGTNRGDLVEFSEAIREEHQKEFPGDPIDMKYAVYWEDPVVVVESYKILSISKNGDKAKVKIEFERLGKTVRDEYVLVPKRGKVKLSEIDRKKTPYIGLLKVVKCRRIEQTTYELKKIHDKWYVWNPPTARISKEKLVELLENDYQLSLNAVNARQGENVPEENEVLKYLRNKIEAIRKL